MALEPPGHLVGVDTIVLSFPDFEMPDDMFISRFNDAVPQAADLDAFGLGLLQVQAMLRWLRTLQRVSIGEAFSLPHVQSIVNILTKTAGPTRERGGSTSWTQYVILADPKNMDAMATAQVLGRFLVDLMPEKGLTPGEHFPRKGVGSGFGLGLFQQALRMQGYHPDSRSMQVSLLPRTTCPRNM